MSKLAKSLTCAVLSFFVLFCAIGYAETSTRITVNGAAEAIPPNELYISAVKCTETQGGGAIRDLYNIHPTTVNQTVTLANTSSSVIVMMTVFNNTSEDYEFNTAKYTAEKYSNANITFSLTNLKTCEPMRHGDVVEAGKHLSFEAKFTFKDGYTPKGAEELRALINYEFLPSSTLPPIYIRDVEVVRGNADYLNSSIGTNLLNAMFTSGSKTVYKITMANRSANEYGYYATVIMNASDTTDITLVDYKLYKDAGLTDSLVRRDLLPAKSADKHGTLEIYLLADGKPNVAQGTEMHTIFDIRFQTPISDIPAPGSSEEGEIAVENALDRFKEILNDDVERKQLEDLLDDVPTSGGIWGSTLRNNTYVAYVPGAPDSDKNSSLELFNGQLEIVLDGQKQDVYFLIKREDVTGDGEVDFTVYMTTNPLTEETTVSDRKGNFLTGYYYTTYNKSPATVYAAVYTLADNDEWIQLGDMFKGAAPICDYNGGMQNYRPSGASSNISVPTGEGSFHTDTWVSLENYYGTGTDSSLPSILAKDAYDLALLKELIDAATPITNHEDYIVLYTKASRDVLDAALKTATEAYANNTDTGTANNDTQAQIVTYCNELERAINGLEDSA